MKVISVMNEKGGIGKTITATSIAWILADKGYNVLLVDGDQQGNASKLYHVIDTGESDSISGLLEAQLSNNINEEVIKRCIHKDNVYNKVKKDDAEGRLDIIPSNGYLMNTNIKIAISEKSGQVLLMKNVLKKITESEFLHDYDYVICDCGLVLDMTVLNILIATDLLIAPIKLGGFEADAINDLKVQIKNLEGFNSHIKVKGLFTMKQKNKPTEQIEEFFKNEHDMFDSIISRSVIVEKSTAAFLPLPNISKNSKVTKQYKSLTDEILEVL
ncbi:MAG: hypothetical protein Q606_CBAC00005G0011 [Intestinibacter bartlettii DORA_8_9]|jgi:chromosome partitioning protein|nr:MAG: hypothetical protein Q606_CBAC00005G0011 [Intestinibacter bartlettii DORA_8_9]